MILLNCKPIQKYKLNEFKIWLLFFTISFISISLFYTISFIIFYPDTTKILSVTPDSYTYSRQALTIINPWNYRNFNELTNLIIYSNLGISFFYSFFFSLFNNIFYSTIIINSILHSLTCYFLFKISYKISNKKNFSIYGGFLYGFLFTPTQWYFQIMKDNLCFIGAFILLFFWVKIIEYKKINIKNFIICLIFTNLGILIIILSRYSYLDLFKYFFAILFFFNTVIISLKFTREKRNNRNLNQFIFSISGMIIILILLNSYIYLISIAINRNIISTYLTNNSLIVSENKLLKIYGLDEEKKSIWSLNLENLYLKPLVIISGIRKNFNIYGGSSIQYGNINFYNYKDLFKFIPYALELGFLKPYPFEKIPNSRFESTSFKFYLGHVGTRIEMFIIYLHLIFLPFAIYIYRKNIIFWNIALFSFGSILFYSLFITNLMTLARFRYPYLLILTALAATAIPNFIKKSKSWMSSLKYY